MPRLTASALWITIIAVLFLLSQDYWSWGDELTMGPGNFPSWIFYFLALQFSLALVLTLFAFTHRRPESDQGDVHTHDQ